MMHLSPGQNPRKMTDKEVKDWRMDMLRMQTENLNQSLGNRFSFHSRAEDYSQEQRSKDEEAWCAAMMRAMAIPSEMQGFGPIPNIPKNPITGSGSVIEDADFEVVSSKIGGK